MNYRGWGNAYGWHYPHFHVEDMEELSNGERLPVMTSIVCNTGDFANQNVDPCFGELWLTLGDVGNTKGGVAFLGPSDLHTQTKFNNSICSGFYQGVLEEDIFGFGTATLRGKMEMYNNFLLNQSPGDMVEFYFYVYNILGDPSLTMRTTIPQQVECVVPEEVSLASNYIEIDCSNLSDGVVTAKKENEFYFRTILEDGNATVFISPETEGDIELTISAPNYIPYQTSINVITESVDVGLYNYVVNNGVNAGEEIEVAISLKNFGSQPVNSVIAN